MRDRLLLGPVLIAALVGMLFLDQWLDSLAAPSWWFGASGGTLPPASIILPLCLALAILGARELAAILKSKGVEASRRILSVAAGAGLLVLCLMPTTTRAPLAVAINSSVAGGVLLTALLYYSRKKSTEGVVAATGGVMLSFVYLGLLFGFLPAIRVEHSSWVLLWVLLTTKACDIGAYFVGKAVGRHKLIPWLSPGKTWEGLLGGVVFASLVGAGGLWVLQRRGQITMPPIGWALFPGVLFGLVGQVGDLLESMLKRDAGIKDSGHSLPGFGGVLDVIDSPLLVAPVAYWLLRAYADAGMMGA